MTPDNMSVKAVRTHTSGFPRGRVGGEGGRGQAWSLQREEREFDWEFSCRFVYVFPFVVVV